jgi:hypothetical protein
LKPVGWQALVEQNSVAVKLLRFFFEGVVLACANARKT